MRATRVLIAEDDFEQREVLERFLRLRGYAAESASSVDSAQRKLERTIYDVLILDWNLPDGTAAQILESAPRLLDRTLVLSADADPPLPLDVDWLRKPVDVRELARSVRRQAERAGLSPWSADPLGYESTDSIVLTLYLGRDPASKLARAAVEEAVERHPSIPIRLEIREIDRNGRIALPGEQVLMVPTLMRYAPLPKAWICGDLSDADRIDDLVLSGAAGRVASRNGSGPSR